MSGASYENPSAGPKIIFYTFPECPWCQRVHILLQELGLPFEQVFINLDEPRPQWYLDINPRGLVPAIRYSNGVINDEIIYESGIINQFLADSRPSHVLPASLIGEDPTAPLRRARIAFFVDTFFSKIGPFRPNLLAEDKEAKAKEIVASIEKDVEPLLEGAAPFFGGSKELTFAEIQVAPFVARYYSLSNDTLLAKSLRTGLEKLPNYSKWAAALLAHPSVAQNYNEEKVVSRTTKSIEKYKAQNKA